MYYRFCEYLATTSRNNIYNVTVDCKNPMKIIAYEKLWCNVKIPVKYLFLSIFFC